SQVGEASGQGREVGHATVRGASRCARGGCRVFRHRGLHYRPVGGRGWADQGKPFVFASTQFTPVLEQENMRKKILTAYQGASVDFVTDQGPVIIDRISAEAKAGGQGQIGLVGAENGELSALAASGVFEDVTKL